MPKPPLPIGKTFGRLTVISDSERSTAQLKYLVCRCSCGQIATIIKSSVIHGQTKSCGCLARDIVSERRAKMRGRLIGKTFGMLTVISAGVPVLRSGQLRETSVCVCRCGSKSTVQSRYLESGNTKSCGCRKRKAWQLAHITHGMTNTRIYKVWAGMIKRCSNPRELSWKYYGERGVKVCERWKRFENFFNDMGEGNSGWSLERLDTNGDYNPNNVVWANRTQQNRNKRNNCILTVRGVTACVTALCEHFNLCYGMIKHRLTRGWKVDEAFFTPRLRKRAHNIM